MRLDSKERKERILQAAIARFSSRGFGGTTTRELAREAGISEALLFRHFPDKKKLYQAILSYKMEQDVPLLLEGLSAEGDIPKVLHDLALRIAKQNLKDPSFMRLLLFSALEGHDLSELFFQCRTLPIVEFLKGLFRKGIGKRQLKGKDPVLMSRCFLAMIHGFLQTRILFRIPYVMKKSVEEVLETYIDIFWEGIRR